MFPYYPFLCFYSLCFCLRSSLAGDRNFLEPQLPPIDILPHVEKYEVVEPLKLPILGVPRELFSESHIYPEAVRYQLGLKKNNYTLHLLRNRHLVGADYTETYTLANGTEVTVRPEGLKHCFYQGFVEGYQDSSVSISTCNGIRGYFQIGSTIHLIEPLDQSIYGGIRERHGNASERAGSDQGKHAVYNEKYLRKKRSSCGVSKTTLKRELEPRMAAVYTPRSWVPGSIPQETHYVELFVVVDYLEYRKYRNIVYIRQRVKEIVNQVDRLYQLLNFRVVLIGLEIWDQGNKVQITNQEEPSLTNFLIWRENILVKKKKHDNAQLISGVDFGGGLVGLARLGSMCKIGSGGVNEDYSFHPFGAASVLAHEMGHNLGMDHDENIKGCHCENSKYQGGCIMQSVGGYWNFPKKFSSCSKDNLQKFLSGTLFSSNCLNNYPDPEQIEGGPVCGNRFVERGEECDCGLPQDCVSQCCNPATCKLTPGSACADGECCQACQFASAGKLCRDAKDSCDLAEYCTGREARCPENEFKENGLPCSGGYCYNGACPTYEQQCQALWGRGSQVSVNNCFLLGLPNGCAQAQFPAQGGLNKCGNLHCSSASTAYVRPACSFILGRDRCDLALTSGENHNHFELVSTGTKCGEKMVCYQKRCQKLTVYGPEDCSKQCHDHGVCNHKRQCHCEPGWAPPNCQWKFSEVKSEVPNPG